MIIIGQKIHFFETIDSTNNKAKELASQGAKEGTVILAQTQTAGRGRGNHKWFSPEGGIYLSVILHPPDRYLAKISQLVLIGAIAGATTLKKFVPPGTTPKIKWPNDLLIEEKKIGGILMESNLSGEKINFLVLGIGINLNPDIINFPEEIRDNATSLKNIGQNQIASERFIKTLLEELDIWYKRFLEGKTDDILKTWNHFADILQKKIFLNIDHRFPTEGIVREIDDLGAIILEINNGEKIRVVNGEVIGIK